MIKTLQTISHSGDGIKNEDKLWFDQDNVLVLDGSTALFPSTIDATWFVTNFAKLYEKNIEVCASIPQAINKTLDSLFAMFKKAISEDGAVAPTFYPSASGLFFHVTDNTLQVVTIGDCCADIYFRDGSQPLCIYDPEVAHFDNGVFESMKHIRSTSGENICDLVKDPRIRSILMRNRSTMNTDEGYRILSFNMTPCTEDEVMEFPVDGISHIVAYTDGFEDVAYLMEDKDYSLQEACNKLRQDELDDPYLNNNIRFKIHDDASAIVFEV